MQTDLIIVSDYCGKCHIEPSFINMLEEEGLIEIRVVGDEHYLLVSQLPDLERYCRLYYDLSINMEGIDVIHHLLDRIERMQLEIDSLHRRLKLYQSMERDEWGE